MKRLWQRIVTDHFVLFAILISFLSLYETAVAGENQLLDHEQLRSLEERIGGLTTEVEKLNKNKSLTPEQQEYIRESVSDAIEDLKLDEQAIRIYSAKANISNILQEYFVGILTLILVIFGASGFGAFRFLEYRIKQRVEQSEKRIKQGAEQIEKEFSNKIQAEVTEQGNVLLAKILKIVGHAHWEGYDERGDDTNLQIAIGCARRALKHAEDIKNTAKYEIEIADAKNNVVYYWIEQKKRETSEESIMWGYAGDILEISGKKKHQKGKDWYEWRDTYIWALLNLNPNSDEQENGKGMLRELMRDRGISPEWREETVERYRKRFGWARQEYPSGNK